MPTYNVTGPDGRKYRVTAPDGATQEEIIAYAQKNASGKATRAPDVYDPTEGMNLYEKFMAGAGKAIVDTGRGLGHLTGLTSQEDINAAKQRDAPLMKTGGGIAGNIAGNLATFVGPGAALGAAGKLAHVPKVVNAARAFLMPKTVLGAGATGAALGAVQPVASDESRLNNILIGGAGGAAIPAAIAATGVAKNLVAPFTAGGRDKLAGRALERFAHDPSSILRAGGELVPGSKPMLAEATQDIGLAQLQRSLRNNPDANNAITARMLANQEARVSALRGIAGDPGKREFFDAARSTTAHDLYEKAFAESAKVSPWIKGEINKLQQRPAFRAAWKDATTLAQNEGIKLKRENVVQVAHYSKLALDDMIGKAQGNEQRALLSTRDKLLSLMESKDFAPSYREARETFAAMSKPINQMDLGQELVERVQPALSEFGATVRTTPQKYADAVRNIDQTAKKATGFRGAKADKILTPEQMATVQNVAKDLGRSANAQDVGRAVGSPTAQNLVGQDVLRQVLGPVGLPKSFADTALAETLLRPVSWAYKAPETRLLGLLGEAAIDPKEARRLLELARKRGMLQPLLERSIPLSSPFGAAGLLGLSE